MITLPTSFVTNFSHPAVFVIRMPVIDSGTAKYLYISSLAFGGVVVHYNGADVSSYINTSYLAAKVANGRAEEEVVPGLAEVDASINIQAGGACMAFLETSVILLNQGDFSSNNGYDIENQPIEIFEGRMPSSGTVDLLTDFILRFKGRMRNVGMRDYTRWSMTCCDRRLVETRPVPVSRLTQSVYPHMQDPQNSKAVPLLFGDWQSAYIGVATEFILDLLPTICIDYTQQKYVLAETDVLSGSALIYADDSQGARGRLQTGGSTGTENGLTYFRLATSSGRNLIPILAEFYIFPSYLGAQGDFINLSGDYHPLIDQDPATYCHLASDASPRISYVALQQISSLTGPTAAYNASTSFQIHVLTANRVGSCALYIRKRSSTHAAVYLGAIAADDQFFGVDPASALDFPNNFDFSNLWDLEIGFWTDGGASMDVYYACIYVQGAIPGILNPAARIPAVRTFGAVRTPQTIAYLQGITVSQWKVPEATKAPFGGIFMNASGPLYPTVMWTSRAYNTGGAVRPIDNAPAVIEWLLRYRLGIQTADIDTASFDAAYTARPQGTWPFQGTVQAQQDAFELIRQICYEFSLILLVTSAGQYRVLALDQASSVYSIQPSDLAWDDQRGPRVEVDYTPNDSITNDFFLDYKLDYTTNEPTKNLYVSDINGDGAIENNLASDAGSPRGGSYSSWLADSKTRYCATRPLQYTLQFIRTAAAAERAIKKLSDWQAFKRLLARMDLVRNTSTMALEVGDIIKLNLDAVTAVHKDTTTFIVTRVRKEAVSVDGAENILSLECEEIPNTHTGVPVLTGRFITLGGAGLSTMSAEPFYVMDNA